MSQALLAGPWPAWVILLPLASAVAAFLLGGRAARTFAPYALGAQLAAAALLAARVAALGPSRHALGGWRAPLGIELHVDGLTAVMILMSAGIALFVGIYARRYFSRDDPESAYFWPLAWFLLAAMNALYLSADVFNLYVTLELMGLAAVGLVALVGEASALAAGMRYLLAALIGSLAYLLGVALLYGVYGTLAIRTLATAVEPMPAVWVAVALITVGLAVKTALFPLHFWLAPAHGGAAVPVSALLSALVINASFYLLLRLWIDLFGAALPPAAGQPLGWLGAAAILWGSLQAILARRLKMLVAYSTVAQIGYLFLVFPLVDQTSAAEAAWTGGVYHAVSHALAKSGMFLAAGAIAQAAGHDHVGELDGVSARAPLSLFAFAMSGVSLMGLPPSGGFIAKWLLLDAALASGQWWCLVALMAGGLLTAAYVFRVLRSAFVPARPGHRLDPAPLTLELTALALSLGAVALGLSATGLLQLARVGAPFAEAAP